MDSSATSFNWVEEKFPLLRLEVNGRSYSYRQYGSDGDPVIALLHGIGSASASWVFQLAGFAANYRVVAWDAPGYGNSSLLKNVSPKS